MAYYAARAIGADNILFWGIDSAAMIEKGEGSDAFWSDSEFAFDKLFPYFYNLFLTF